MVAQRRALLLPREATTEGSRRLRVLLRRLTFERISKQSPLHCDERAVRAWAREESKLGLISRDRLEAAWGIPPESWDQPPLIDCYDGPEPGTTKRF